MEDRKDKNLLLLDVRSREEYNDKRTGSEVPHEERLYGSESYGRFDEVEQGKLTRYPRMILLCYLTAYRTAGI